MGCLMGANKHPHFVREKKGCLIERGVCTNNFFLFCFGRFRMYL